MAKYYEDMDGTKTGNTQPTWTAGAHRDVVAAEMHLWRYSGGGWGIVEITALAAPPLQPAKSLLNYRPA